MTTIDFENYVGILSEDKELHSARYEEIKNEFMDLANKNKEIFLKILENDSILSFKDYFREKDYKNMLDLYGEDSIKGNFNYLSAIMLSLMCKEAKELNATLIDLDDIKDF